MESYDIIPGVKMMHSPKIGNGYDVKYFDSEFEAKEYYRKLKRKAKYLGLEFKLRRRGGKYYIAAKPWGLNVSYSFRLLENETIF